jgi:Arm DNA-binding domain
MNADNTKITAAYFDALTAPRLHPDGGGLNLQITRKGSRSWLFRYRFHGKQIAMGLGSCSTTTLAQARRLRDEARAWLRKGVDPITVRGRRRPITATEALTIEERITALEDAVDRICCGLRIAIAGRS